MEFKNFRDKVLEKINSMKEEVLFVSKIDSEKLYNIYLESFPQGTNETFNINKEHDCIKCKDFIKKIGKVVTINNDLELVSIWDIDANYPYNIVANKLSEAVKKYPLEVLKCDKEIYGEYENTTVKEFADGTKKMMSFNHFGFKVPKKYISKNSISEFSFLIEENYNIFKNRLSNNKISINAVKKVISAAEMNLLLKNDNYQEKLKNLLSFIEKYQSLSNERKKDLYLWKHANNNELRILLSSPIGTLIEWIHEGMDLEKAINKYNEIVKISLNRIMELFSLTKVI